MGFKFNPFTGTFDDIGSGTSHSPVTLISGVGSIPNANGMTLTGQAIGLQMCDFTNPGVLQVGAHNISEGTKTFRIQAGALTQNAVEAKAIASQTGHAFAALNSSGTVVGAITVAGRFQAPAGSASSPSIFFNGTSSGLYNVSGSAISIATTGSQRMQIDGNGYVTIGGDYGTGWATVQIQNSQFPTVNPTFAVKLYSGQTTDLVQITNTSSTPRVGVTKEFYTYFGNNGVSYANTSNFFASMAAANHLIVLRGATAQSADLLRFIDVADTLLSSFDNSGNWQANSKNIYKLTNIIDNSSVTTIQASDRMLVDDTGKKALQWLDSGRLLKDNTEVDQMEWNTSGIKIHNKVYSYNGDTGVVESNCVPYIVGKFSAVGTTSDYTAQTIFTPLAGSQYRISWTLEVTSTGGTADLTLNWTSNIGAESRKLAYLISSATTGTLVETTDANGDPKAKQGTMTTIITSGNTSDVTFDLSWSGGNPTYNITIYAERLY